MTNKPTEEHSGDEIAEMAEEVSVEDNVANEENEMGGGELGILNKKIEFLERSLHEKSEEILRRAADTDNYRKRLMKESDDRVKYANQSVVMDFLPVLDNIELTLQHAGEGTPLRQGLELTIKSFQDTLAKHGVKEVEAGLGVPFDPAKHEALMMDSSDEFENNAITLCVQKGYSLNDRVIRPAKVKVNKR